MIDRRRFIITSALALPQFARAASARFSDLPLMLAQLEADNGGRLGVAVLDTATGERNGYRQGERFAMCSTFKFLLASRVLQRVDHHEETLARLIPIPPKEQLQHYSPLTEAHAGDSMSIESLCEAVLTQSDNTAANALLATIGGPAGITRFARSISDAVTRLDRIEPALNEALDKDPRDTTSPASMVNDLRAVLLGNVLAPASRERITRWMEDCQTGLERLRAKLPSGWRAADKTGSNGEHTSNDIAVFWPDARPPVIVAAYITHCFGPEKKRAAMHAHIGELVMQALA